MQIEFHPPENLPSIQRHDGLSEQTAAIMSEALHAKPFTAGSWFVLMDMLRQTATSRGEMTSHRAALSFGQVFIEPFNIHQSRSHLFLLFYLHFWSPPAGGAPPAITSDIHLISRRLQYICTIYYFKSTEMLKWTELIKQKSFSWRSQMMMGHFFLVLLLR